MWIEVGIWSKSEIHLFFCRYISCLCRQSKSRFLPYRNNLQSIFID